MFQFKHHPVSELGPSDATLARPTRLTKRRGVFGFSLIEIMITLAIISMVAAAGVPQVRKSQRRAKATIIANDFRTFAAVFEAYAQEKGAWPAETAAGITPPEVADRLNTGGWLRVTPLGGQYNWENNQMHGGVRYRAALSISETPSAPLPVDAEMLLEIDREIDDGNLTTGSFRIGVNNDPLFILQQ
jgi:prepilin-type N-terminal cleavage/methylation domain-containing protein